MMPPLGELDVNAPRPKLYKQATLESFTGGKHARLSSSGSTDDFYTSGPESTRVHPSSQTDEERPLKKRLRRTHAATDSSDDEDDIPRVLLPSQRRLPSQINAATFLARRGIAPANALAALTRQRVSQSAYISTYVSNDTLDVYRIASEHDRRTWAPPFACAFSNARDGGKQMLAVSDEEGNVNFIDPSRNANEDRMHGRVAMKMHENAIFDVRWSADDSMVATASGDQTVGLTDVQTQKAVARLVGHLSSVKQVAFDPTNTNILATASRDGSIRIWDIRESCKGPSTPNLIRNAHAVAGTGKSLSKTPRSAARSVTSIVFLNQRDGLLASGGTADGVVKLWDLRKTHTKRANPVPVAASHDLTRGRGLSSLAQGSNGTRLHALGIDSSLYTLDPLALAHDEHLLPAVRPNGLAQGNATFYVRLAVRPCGRFVVSGTSKNDALVWDSEAPAYAAPVRLSGHKGEVGAVDWGRDAIATCGDDMQVRLWRPSTVMARRCQADEELRNWHWSGAWPRPAAHP